MFARRSSRHGVQRERSNTFARVRALLAGALVLGVGATVTLAAWTDQEHASGALKASVFNTESKSGAGAWAHNTQAPGATLNFAAPAMFPGALNYASLDVRTTTTTTVGGTVKLATATKSDVLADGLQYRAVLLASTGTCAAAAFTGTPTWIAGGPTTYLAAGTMPTSPPSSPIAAGGVNPLKYCFEILLPTNASNSLQGKLGTVGWSFIATSTG